MAAVDQFDALEGFLQTSRVVGLASHGMGGGGHPGSFLVILEAGIGALAKLESATPDAPLMVRRERAAWVLARRLGWSDMVAATVLRAVPTPTGGEGSASVQILWPAAQVGVAEANFPEDDQWRAAIFDALTRATDRHAANWLAVPREPGAGQQRLKLVDHGHAFDLTRGISTPFYLSRRGEEIPPEYADSLDALDLGGLDDLLQDAEKEGLQERLTMLRRGVLDINEP